MKYESYEFRERRAICELIYFIFRAVLHSRAGDGRGAEHGTLQTMGPNDGKEYQSNCYPHMFFDYIVLQLPQILLLTNSQYLHIVIVT